MFLQSSASIEFNTDSNPYLVTITDSSTTSYYYIVHLEPYEKRIINGYTSYLNPNQCSKKYNELKSSDRVYNCITNCLLKDKDLIVEPDTNKI